jgi:FkbM family methyltransferase
VIVELPRGRAQARAALRRIAEIEPAGGPRPVDKPLVLFGAGNLGRLAAACLRKLDVAITAVVDSNAAAHRESVFWRETSVLEERHVGEALRRSAMLAVCVAASPYEPIRRALQDRGWLDVVPIYDVTEAYRDRLPLANGWFTRGLSAPETAAIGDVLDDLEDDTSRGHHLQFAAWHHARHEWLFPDAPVSLDERYFPPEVRRLLRVDERFADIGAHAGEVTARFVAVARGRFERAWALEPDSVNRMAAESVFDNLSAEDRGRIALLPVAVGSGRGSKRFAEGYGYASQFFDRGTSVREVVPIDDLGLAPTFVKVHLEGWELDALRGATRTLEQHRPIVAATIYHDRRGLWETVRWAMDTLKDYRFFVRQHAYLGTGVVLYAIPRERETV